MGRCWVRPAGMLPSPPPFPPPGALSSVAGFVASSKIERPPTTLTSPPPHLRWRPTSPRQVGGGGLRWRPTSPRQVGGGGLRRPETSTLRRYVGKVHCRGPTFPFERAFTTGPLAAAGEDHGAPEQASPRNDGDPKGRDGKARVDVRALLHHHLLSLHVCGAWFSARR